MPTCTTATHAQTQYLAPGRVAPIRNDKETTMELVSESASGVTPLPTSALRAAVALLRSHPASTGRAVGSIGFCMGGNLSALLASAEPELGAAAIFYGSSPTAEQVGSIRCPVRGFYGQDDPRIVGGLAAFDAALSAASVDHELRIYPSTGHAFFNDTRPSYRPKAARDAWSSTLAFFAHTLAPVTTVAVKDTAPAS
jgi:dienelactone hydrolase